MDYINFQITSFSTISVPPAIHWRVSMDFWIFVHDTSQLTNASGLSASHVTYSDFMTLSFAQGNSTNDLMFICTPFEYMYSVKTNNTKNTLLSKLSSLGAFYMTDNRSNAFNSWNYVRCAFSLHHKKSYLLNMGAETSLPIPQMYYNYSSFSNYFKKFYVNGATVNLSFDQISSNINTEVYIRNFNVFREYIPYSMDLKFFNLYKITPYTLFPQLLFSIPFNSATVTSVQVTGITMYDFSTEQQTSIKTSTVGPPTISGSGTIPPPRNFKRLNLLDPNNQWSTNEMVNMTPITCNSPSVYCQNINVAFTCQPGYYLDVILFVCNQNCPTNYMRLPDEISFNNMDYCSYNCPTNTMCPSSGPSAFKTINNNFSCSGGFITNFYQCSNPSLNNFSKFYFN